MPETKTFEPITMQDEEIASAAEVARGDWPQWRAA